MQSIHRSALAAMATLALGACAQSSTLDGARFSAPPSSQTGNTADAGAAPVDSYEDVGSNPFVDPSHDPFSTFAADVDTASYDIFRRDVEEYERLPSPASVRLEEYVNYFNYGYQRPASGAETPFAIDLALAEHPLGREHAQLRVGISAEARPAFVKLPSNLVFLIDTSGSMSSANKLPLVQRLLSEALDQLDAEDTISIVTYAGSTRVALRPTPASDVETIRRVIDSFNAGGSTAGGAGINLAYEQAQTGFIDNGFNHVVLCTDGDFNVGLSSTEALVELIEEKRESGITLTALGFGAGNLNDAMMERVSNAGNGIYSVIANEEHASRYAREDLLDTIHHVARDMKIQVEFNPEHVVAYRLLGYVNRAIADHLFRDDTVDAGEVGAGHQVTALYDVILRGEAIPAAEGAPGLDEGESVEGEREIEAGELVQVRVRYKRLGDGADDPALEVNASVSPASLCSADADTQYASAVAALAEIIHESPYADGAELSAIEAVLREQADRDRDRAELYSLFMQARSLLEAL